jgi:hypothetical protein
MLPSRNSQVADSPYFHPHSFQNCYASSWPVSFASSSAYRELIASLRNRPSHSISETARIGHVKAESHHAFPIQM